MSEAPDRFSRRHVNRAALGLMLGAGLRPARAQTDAGDWPSRPVTILVGYPPGNATDTIARMMAERLAAYPNAGLPNAMGGYDETPDQTSSMLGEWARSGLVNILGGCCGTTPDHIRQIAEAAAGVAPRQVPERPKAMRLSGLEPFELAS